MSAAPAAKLNTRPSKDGRVVMSFDYETYCDIDLTKVGLDAYSRHPSCEIILAAYAFDDGPVHQWSPLDGQEAPQDFLDALGDEQIIKQAWNAPFERAITAQVLGVKIPFTSLRDTMVVAYAVSLPGSLSKCGEVLMLPDELVKMKGALALVKLFTQPQKPTERKQHLRNFPEYAPEKWAQFKDYNRQDVDAERAIALKLAKHDMSDFEWALWRVDQEINQAGVPFNMKMVDNACRIYRETVQDRLARMRDLTGLANPNSNVQILQWLRDRGYRFTDLTKSHVKKGLQDALADDPEAAESITKVLRYRLEVSRVSPKKYLALQRATDRKSSVLRNTLQFQGAGRTGRWAGRMFQAQNLPRPAPHLEKSVEKLAYALENVDREALEFVYEDPMEVLVSCIRPAAQAPNGFMFIDADLNAIENRVLGWLSDCKKIMDVYAQGRDPYLDFATYMYKQSYAVLSEEYSKGDKKKRTTSKPGVLGCLGSETSVLTDNGWKKIVEVSWHDKVFDGVEFVQHGGVVYQGRKEMLCGRGISATPDHKFLTARGWRRWDSILELNTCLLNHTEISGRPQGGNKTTINGPSWDILNCGKRKCFVILTENGQAVAHNCGYQLSAGKEILNRETGEIEATGLLGYARNMGVVMTAEEAQASVKTFRETFVEVPKFWKEVERTAKRAVQKKIPCAIGPVVFDVQDDFMRIRLPSDRFLYYHQPRVRMGETSWGEERLQLSYMGLNERNQWHRTSTYGGKLTENLCQAIARDLLALGIARAHKAGLDIRLHVHDQIVALSRTERAKHDLEVLKACMTNTVPWAKDLPLAAGGFVSKVFLKD